MDTQSIWEEFSGNLREFIRIRVHDDFDAELQDVFRKIHNNIDKIKEDTKVQGWVFQIARNTIIDHYRSQFRGISVTIEGYEDALFSDAEDTDNYNETVASWLKCAIPALPEKYREAIRMTEIQNMTQKEVANHLGISISGAKSRVQRGREKLKELILNCCHLEFDRLGNVVDYFHNQSCCTKGRSLAGDQVQL